MSKPNAREQRGPDALDDAGRRLASALHERDEAEEAVRTPSGGSADAAAAGWRLAHAENRVAAQEAWLAWVELGDGRS